MQYIISVLKSKTVWAFIALFAFGGVSAIHPVVSGNTQVVVEAILAALGVYFRVNPAQIYPKA